MQGTDIEWTDYTWNPLRGCSRASRGCANCYAERIAARFSGPGQPYEGLADRARKGSKWTGKVQLIEPVLRARKPWKQFDMVFVNSMSDLFHERVKEAWIDAILDEIKAHPDVWFQVLTKRSDRMRRYFEHKPVPPNLWLGVSCEDRDAWDQRSKDLNMIDATVRFVSAEPLLEIFPFGRSEVDWLIIGGESGPGARPMPPEDDVRLMIAHAQEQGVPVFFKQWGGSSKGKGGHLVDGAVIRQFPRIPAEALP